MPTTVAVRRVDVTTIEDEAVGADAIRIWPRRPFTPIAARDLQLTAIDINEAAAHDKQFGKVKDTCVLCLDYFCERIRSYGEDERRDPVTTGVADAP